MKTAKLFTVVLLGLAFVFTSCKKYEDGPAVSLLPKKARLTGTWTPVKSIDGDGSVSEYSDEEVNMVFKKDGTYINRITPIMFEGKWEFNGDKTKIILSNTGTLQIGKEQTILRLTNNELWLKDGDTETHYEKVK
ncbi:MAG TPA: hypothetical protein VKX29_06195 [Brumimicrobium sp.]|nr:hypothetical protein [Brumimicrobium sp.]